MRTIKITDVTLRDCAEKSTGTLSFKEKIEIAKLLDKLGVDVIEAGPITDEKTDTLVLHTIAPLLKNSVLSCPVGLSTASADKAFNAISSAAKCRLLVALPVSAVQMEYICHKKPDKMIELITKLVSYSKTLCEDVEFAALDAARCDISFLVKAVKAAVDAGATCITIAEKTGSVLPDDIVSLSDTLYSEIPSLKDITVCLECNNELDMANACIFAGIGKGITQFKAAVGSDNVPSLESIVHAISVKGASIDVSTATDAMMIKNISSQLQRMISSEKKSGSPFDNDSSFRDSNVLLDDTSDISKVSKAVKSLGYDLNEDDIAKVYESFKSVSSKKRVGAVELDTIVANVAHQVPPTYRIIRYVINTGNVIQSTANIVLEKNGRELKSVCMGNGPIDAAFLTIEQIIGHHYEVDDFQIQSVTEGREAMGNALVKLRSEGKVYSGKGVSTDIIGASIIAYINALNKIVYEENSI